MVLPTGAAVSGASAAHVLGAYVVADDVAVEVTVPRERRMSAQSGVVVRYSQLSARDVVRRSGISATSPVRTAFDMARRTSLDDAVVAVDALLRFGGLRPDAIAAYASDGRRGWPGVGRVADVLALAAVGAESPMETRLRLALTRGGLPAPVLQYRVRDAAGRPIARLDLAYVEARLGIEYDGEHHWEPAAVRQDLRRQNALRALGWSLLRFTADDVVHQSAQLVAQVRAAAVSRT